MTNPEQAIPDKVQVQMVWIGAEDAPILMINTFQGQVEKDECIITLGQMTPPALAGTPEERLEQVRRLPFVPIKTVARLGLTRQRLEEFVTVLSQTMEIYDKAHA